MDGLFEMLMYLMIALLAVKMLPTKHIQHHISYAIYTPNMRVCNGIYKIPNPHIKYGFQSCIKCPKYDTEIGLLLYAGIQEAIRVTDN